MSENPVFSFKIPGPARVLLPILPTLEFVGLQMRPGRGVSLSVLTNNYTDYLM